MKILVALHDFVPETLAGTEINAHVISTNLLARGHQVSLFCRGWNLTNPPYSLRDEVLDGIQVRRVDFGTSGQPLLTQRVDPVVEQLFREYLAEVKPDLVHFHHLLYLSTGLLAIAKEAGLPVLLSLHDYWFRCPQLNLLYYDDTLCDRTGGPGCLSCLWPSKFSRKRKVLPWRVFNPPLVAAYRAGMKGLLPGWSQPRRMLDSLARWTPEMQATLRQADRIHSPSQFLADVVVRFGYPAGQVAVIENGIRAERIHRMPKTPSGLLRLGIIGTAYHKGMHVAVEAMRRLPYDKAELQVYGHLSEPRYLRRLKTMTRGANVRFMDAFSQDELGQLFAGIDALLVPSIWYENCPTVIREAFANGTPVITSDIGGMAEAVRDGVDGYLFQVGNTADLAAKLQLLIDDPQRLRYLQQNVRPPITAGEVCDQFEALYQRLMAPQSAGLARGERAGGRVKMAGKAG